jgi:hypothetical protein
MPTTSQKIIQVTSIIMIVGGGIGIIVSLMGFASVALLVALGASGMLYLAMVFAVLASIFELIAGIIGVKNYKNPASGQKLFTLGLICCLISILSQVLTVALGGQFNFLSLVLGLVLPGLYTYAAYNLKTGKP